MACDLCGGVADVEGDVGDEPVAAANEGALYERAGVREVENPGHDVHCTGPCNGALYPGTLRMCVWPVTLAYVCVACTPERGLRNERRRETPHL